jgi:hypothetical protein
MRLYEEQKAVEEQLEDEAQVEEGESRMRQGEVQETDEEGSVKGENYTLRFEGRRNW